MLDNFIETSDCDFESSLSRYFKKQFSAHTTKGFLENSMSSMDIVSVADRLKLSNRELVYIAAAFAKANNHDIEGSTFSYSSVRRKRIEVRNSLVEKIRNNGVIEEESDLFYVVHWDGKILVNSTDDGDGKFFFKLGVF
jgi:hypothetical protein